MIKYLKKQYAVDEYGAKGIIYGSIAAFIHQIALTIPVFIVIKLISEGIAYLETGYPMHPLSFYVMVTVLSLLFIFVTSYVTYSIWYVYTYRSSERIRLSLAEIMRAVPLSYYSQHDIADISSAIMRDVNDIETAISHYIPQTFGMFGYLVCIIAYFMYINPILGLATFITLPLTLGLMLGTKKVLSSLIQTSYENKRVQSDAILRAYETRKEIEANNMMDQIETDIDALFIKDEAANIKMEMMVSGPIDLSYSLLKAAIGVVMMTASALYIKGDIALFTVVVSLMLTAKIYDPMQKIYSAIGMTLYIKPRVARIHEMHRLAETDVRDGKTPKSFDVAVSHVSFGYQEGTQVLSDVSFSVPSNSVTALIGPSGSGKTTLMRLISSLYDTEIGEIRIGGISIKEMSSETLFKYIAIVFQDVTLFNNTFMENIRMGRIDATDDEVIEAAKRAQCHDFIMEAQHGYDTMIGENGSLLSGGQRQRISIARAILKDAPIILLDEITSSVDIENERLIQESLNDLIQDKTVIVIAHRLKFIEKADHILLLESGRVVDQGTHHTLLESSKLYQNMIHASSLSEKHLF